MEPHLKTPSHLCEILEELRQREPIFHHAEIGATREDFESMTDPDFWEVGASGRRYSRENVINTLVERYSVAHEDIWKADGFHCCEIAENNYLLTYTLVQDNTRKTRRSTIWRKAADGWKILYHQGTMAESNDS